MCSTLPPLRRSFIRSSHSEGSVHVTRDSDPIADFDVRSRTKRKRSRGDLALQSTPPLPPYSSPDFARAFETKLSICNAECDWDDPEADTSAKKVQTATLSELFDFLKTVPSLQTSDLEKLVSVAERPLFRHYPDLSPVHLRFDDMAVFVEPSWPCIWRQYQLLTSLASTFCDHPHFSDISYLRSIINRFFVPDLNERTSLARFVILLLEMHPSRCDAVLRLALDATADYRDGARSPHVVVPSLMLVIHFWTEQLPPPDLYFRYILPLLAADHFTSFQSQIGPLIELFLRAMPETVALRTAETLLRCFPRTQSQKAIECLRLLALSLAKAPPRHARPRMQSFFLHIAKCTSLGHVGLAAASVPAWNRPELAGLITDNARAVLRTVYPVLIEAQRETWSADIAAGIDNIFRAFGHMDAGAFQEVCRGRAPPAPAPGFDAVRVWGAIARVAAKADGGISLTDTLAEIQKTFAVATKVQSFRAVARKQGMCASKQNSQPSIVAPLVLRL
jgi:hypothetical protein